MKRTFVRLAACFAVTAIALASSTVHADGHGKKRSFAPSGGANGGGGNGPSFKAMKLQTNASRNFNNFKSLNSGSGGPSFNSSLARKMNKSFATNQGNGTLPNINITNKNLKFSRNGQLNSKQFAAAIDKGKFRSIDLGNGKPIGDGIGNGPENKYGKFPSGKFKGWNPEKFADVMKQQGKFPIGDKKFDFDKKFGDKKFDADWKDKFGDKFNGKFGDKFCDTPNQDKNCHDGFPWWKLWINCYPNNCYPSNCYHNDWHCHYPNNCYPPIYYNYPPVTNVTVVNPLPPEPAQPTLVDGIDLELVDLRLVDLGDAAKGLGPRYRITFRNRGKLPAGNFQVMLLASSDGTPQPGLPSGIAEVAGAPAGQLLTTDVRLTPTPDLAKMNNLIVALDTATQVVETEESNNVAVIDRAKVLMADLAVR